jgi:hypothetical protein
MVSREMYLTPRDPKNLRAGEGMGAYFFKNVAKARRGL